MDKIKCTIDSYGVKYTIDSYGVKEWTIYGALNILHNKNGPAVVYPDGHKEWWLNGKLYRLNGPVVVESDGTKLYYNDNQVHREDGPAIIYLDGTIEWWINDKIYSFDDWCNKLNLPKDRRIELKMCYE